MPLVGMPRAFFVFALLSWRMAIRTELNLRLPNSPGALATVCRTLADERVRITAMSLDGAGLLRLLLDNPVRGAGVLRDRRHTIVEREVIVVQVATAPGSLAVVLTLLADAGVNVEYAYAATPEGGPMTVAVLGVDDAMRAATMAGV
jgi:hypothetical protein